MIRFTAPLVVLAALVAAAPAQAAQITATTSANVVKPVALTKLQDMDFGTLLVENYTGTRTISLSRAGVVTCAADIACSGAPRQARFNVQGTNRMVVVISVTSSGLTNGTDTIPFTPDAPSSITLTSSGVPGTNFDVGGSLSVSGSIPGGAYTGTMTVTANYQ